MSPLFIEKVGLAAIRAQLIDIHELWQQRNVKVQNLIVQQPLTTKHPHSAIDPINGTETIGKLCTQKSLAAISAPAAGKLPTNLDATQRQVRI